MASVLVLQVSPSGAVTSAVLPPVEAAWKRMSCGSFFAPRIPPRTSSLVAQARSPSIPFLPIAASAKDSPSMDLTGYLKIALRVICAIARRL